MEYTKGEWWVEVLDNCTTVEADSQTICTDVSNCDAHLIAAAPAMYEALKYIRQQILLGHYAGNDYECAHCKLEKALAQAREE